MDRLLSKMQTLQFAARKGSKGGDAMETYLLIGIVLISLITLGVLLYHQFMKKRKAENYAMIDEIEKMFEKGKKSGKTLLDEIRNALDKKENYAMIGKTFDCDGAQKEIDRLTKIYDDNCTL